MKRFVTLTAILLVMASETAAITVDGVLDVDYDAPIVVQAVQTQFGDEGAGCDSCGGELDAAYAKIENDRLFLMITGNLEDNFNKLNIFIDSKVGGENELTGIPEYDHEPNAGTGDWISKNYGPNTELELPGMRFDAGFEADYHLFSRAGLGNYEVDLVDRQGGINAQVPGARGGVTFGGTAGAETATGIIFPDTLGPNASGSSVTQDLLFGWDNSNNAGVSGGTGAADQVAAAAVTTGMEFSIHLDDIGDPAPGSMIKITAFYANGDHNYMSNQVLAPFTPPQANPGGDGSNPGEPEATGAFTGTMSGMNFNNFAGTQFFTLVVPEASTNNGDHNGDGVVDAADYVTWRKIDASQGGYDAFVEHFGESVGPGGAAGVPEPASMLLVVIGLSAISALRLRKLLARS